MTEERLAEIRSDLSAARATESEGVDDDTSNDAYLRCAESVGELLDEVGRCHRLMERYRTLIAIHLPAHLETP